VSTRQSGFALLIVLWTVGFLALLGTQLVSAARTDTQLATNLKQDAVLQAAADGAVQQVMFAMQAAHDPAFRPGGREIELRIGQTAVLARIESETDRINLNTASPALLRALLIETGSLAAQADALVATILDWRTAGASPRQRGAKAPDYRAAGLGYGPPGAPFQSVDELADVLGMTRALFDRLAPHLTVFTDGDPDLTTHDPVVARALTDAAGESDTTSVAQQSAEDVMRISVTALGRDGARYAATVVTSAELQDGPPRVKILLRQRLGVPTDGLRMTERN
jgi:general secretion pathway protein K